MKTNDEQILAAYEMFEDAEPDISTERLLQQVADSCRCDVDRVVDALFRRHKQEEKAKKGAAK